MTGEPHTWYFIFGVFIFPVTFSAHGIFSRLCFVTFTTVCWPTYCKYTTTSGTEKGGTNFYPCTTSTDWGGGKRGTGIKTCFVITVTVLLGFMDRSKSIRSVVFPQSQWGHFVHVVFNNTGILFSILFKPYLEKDGKNVHFPAQHRWRRLCLIQFWEAFIDAVASRSFISCSSVLFCAALTQIQSIH